MNMVARRTVSLPEDLARKVEAVAKKEKRSFSGAIARLVEEALGARTSPYRFIGAGRSGVSDLGRNDEKYLRELFEKFED